MGPAAMLLLAAVSQLSVFFALISLFIRSRSRIAAAQAYHYAQRQDRQRSSSASETKKAATQSSVKMKRAASLAEQGEAALHAAIDDVLEASSNYRYLEAEEQLDVLQLALGMAKGDASKGPSARLQELLASKGEGSFEELRTRAKACRTALETFNGDQSGWTLVTSSPNMTMRRRDEADSLIVKIDAVLHGVRPADTLMVWREGALYSSWFPLVSASAVVDERHHAETVIHILISRFGHTIDLVLRGYGCDNLREGYFLLVVRPARQQEFPDVALPPKPKGGMMAMRVKADIDILVEPLSQDSVRFAYTISQKLPPGLPVPRWMLNFVVQHGMGQIFAEMEKVARRMAVSDPSSPHVKHVSRSEYAPTLAVALNTGCHENAWSTEGANCLMLCGGATASWIRERVDKLLSVARSVAA